MCYAWRVGPMGLYNIFILTYYRIYTLDTQQIESNYSSMKLILNLIIAKYRCYDKTISQHCLDKTLRVCKYLATKNIFPTRFAIASDNCMFIYLESNGPGESWSYFVLDGEIDWTAVINDRRYFDANVGNNNKISEFNLDEIEKLGF